MLMDGGGSSSVFLFLTLGTTLFALALTLFVFWRLHRVEKKLERFFSGKEARDLEQVLVAQIDRADGLNQELDNVYAAVEELRKITAKSIHKVALDRFNPFKEVGGNQSFSVALLDAENSGVVISSLHTREGTRVYGKPIVRGNATNYPLTEEEKAVVADASGIRRKKR